MTKNKRKINKARIIKGSRVYTIIATDGPVMHYFELGTLVRKTFDAAWPNEFVELGARGLTQNLRSNHYR